MARGSLNPIEVHIEKLILALTGAFLLYSAWAFLIRSPNTIQLENRRVGPAGLNEAILESARRLEDALRKQTPEPVRVENYSRRLRQMQDEGIFVRTAEGGPRLEPELPRLTYLGTRIEVPGLKEDEEAGGNITLVTPLRPDPPAVATGRSLARRVPVTLGATEAAPRGPSAGTVEATETPWVTLATWFPVDAQREEMIRNGYAAYRARVYVVGLDVQRQEMLSSGEFSDWKDVKSGAMPEIHIPDPVFDETTGALLNSEQIERAFNIVRSEQKTLMQPEFLYVENGDEWENPLPEFRHEEEEQEEPNKDVRKKEEPKPRPTVRPPARPPAGGIRGGGGDPRRGGGDAIGGGRIAGPGPVVDDSAAQEAKRKAEGRRQATKDMLDATKAFARKEYGSARDLVQRVVGNEFATAGTRRRAEALLKKIEKALERQSGPMQEAVSRDPRMAGGGDVIGEGEAFSPRLGPGPRGAPSVAGAVPQRRTSEPLVVHPEKPNVPAVWFHDDTVESGKTYRYRARIKLWNRYVGRMKALANPADARKTVITGEWSLPSEPITVAPSTYFFVAGSAPGKPSAAGIEVWKWRQGMWLRHRVDVEVGDAIGEVRRVRIPGEFNPETGQEVSADVDFNTGAVVLDIRTEPVKVRLPGRGGQFRHNETRSTVLTYLDPADGQVKERVEAFDRNDPIRTRLRDELIE